MVGAAVDVAQSRLSLETLKLMMLQPADYYESDQITILKPNGLFLKNVKYD